MPRRARSLALISAQTGVRLGAGRASCIIDDYATSRSRYRELACILAPAHRRPATVLIAAAQPGAWAQTWPVLRFASLTPRAEGLPPAISTPELTSGR